MRRSASQVWISQQERPGSHLIIYNLLLAVVLKNNSLSFWSAECKYFTFPMQLSKLLLFSPLPYTSIQSCIQRDQSHISDRPDHFASFHVVGSMYSSLLVSRSGPPEGRNAMALFTSVHFNPLRSHAATWHCQRSPFSTEWTVKITMTGSGVHCVGIIVSHTAKSWVLI